MASRISSHVSRSEVLAGVPHGFFGHGGGRFQFGYGGDGNPAEIAAVRQAAAHEVCPGAVFVAPHQVHSPDVIVVEQPWQDMPSGRPEGDALVTDRRGLALGIVTADCAPVLLADREVGVIGAAHAGWKGAHGGVLENTVAAMESLGARRSAIAAAIGPTIAQPSYEVDDGFRNRFPAEAHRFFLPGREGHWQFDLPSYCRALLGAAGVGVVADLACDTYAMEDRYYSFRRATHRNEANYGRQLSIIALA